MFCKITISQNDINPNAYPGLPCVWPWLEPSPAADEAECQSLRGRNIRGLPKRPGTVRSFAVAADVESEGGFLSLCKVDR